MSNLFQLTFQDQRQGVLVNPNPPPLHAAPALHPVALPLAPLPAPPLPAQSDLIPEYQVVGSEVRKSFQMMGALPFASFLSTTWTGPGAT